MKKRRIKWKNVFLFILIIIFAITLFISITNIIKWNIESKKSNQEINNLQENTIIEMVDENNTQIIENDISENDPYWNYIKMDLIDVDFKDLKNTNNDTVGWIQVNGTNINYPFVQSKDNNYYLNHSFNKSYNTAGWVFMDYRNNYLNLDKNTIIYAHGRRDNTMFGTLKNILSNNWIKDTNNYIVKIATETENNLYQVFSIYNIPETSDYLKIEFDTNEEFKNFAQTLINRSEYNFNTTVNENDKIITLSTCYNMTNRIVLHAKLIKTNKKTND